MVKKHITQTIDDLDGSLLEDGTTLTFSLEGRSYEIDLSPENAEELREVLRPYVSAGRPIASSSHSSRRTPRGRAIPTRDLIDVRAWAQKNGFAINDRGRISTTVLAAYDAAH